MDLLVTAIGPLLALAIGYFVGRMHAIDREVRILLESQARQVTEDRERLRREVAQFDFEAAEKRQRRFKL